MKTAHKLVTAAIVLVLFTVSAIIFLGILLPVTHSNLHAHPLRSYPVLTYSHKQLPSGEYVDAHSYRIRVSSKVVDSSSTSGAILSVHPALVHSGDTVSVKWSGVAHPSSTRDWVGMYCPPEKPPHAYLEYWLARDSPTYREGHGQISLRAYNMREECQFRYYTNGTVTELLASSNRLRFEGGRRAPLQGHLALTGNPTEMRVQWTSGTSSVPMVWYGFTADQLNWTATGVSRTYTASDMCGSPANESINFIDPGFLHDVLLTGLHPSTLYYYQYGSEGVVSEVRVFTSSPALGGHQTLKIITYGDMSVTPGAMDTVRLVGEEVDKGAGLIIHQGDLSYAVGYAYIWDQWMHLIEPVATRVPYMIAVGNHEQDHMVNTSKDPSNPHGRGFHPSWGNFGHDSGGECGVATSRRFHMPDNGNGVWWYSFNYGPVHFTVMSTEHDFTPGSHQYKWLEQDLQSVDRNSTPWLILVGHRPMYSSLKIYLDHIVSVHIRESLEELLHRYRVDVMLAGHDHSYERTCPVYRGRCTNRGTVHIVIGTAGFQLDLIGHYNVRWSKHLEVNYGYGRMTVSRSALLWEYVRNIDQSVTDSVRLVKHYWGEPEQPPQ